MKTTSAVLALLLLASPMLAAMGTYGTSTATLGSSTGNKFGWTKDSDTRTKFVVTLTGITAPTSAANVRYCVVVGIPASGSTATNWNGADVGSYTITGTYNAACNTWAVTDPEDNSCTTQTDGECQLKAKETNNGWGFATDAAAADKLGYSGTTLMLEGSRLNAATDATGDIAIDKDSTKVLLGWNQAATATTACPTGTDDIDFATDQSGLTTGLTSPVSSTTSSSSFGALTYLSWVALLISYALLN